MCKNRRNRFITREHAAQVFFEELRACESIKDSPGPCPSAQYTIHDLHTAAINELWDLAHLLGVDNRLHELEQMWLRKPPVLEKGVLVRLRDGRTARVCSILSGGSAAIVQGAGLYDFTRFTVVPVNAVAIVEEPS